MKKQFKKLVSTLLAVILVMGTAVMTPVADIVGTKIVAEATSEPSSYIYHNCIGKYLDAGTQIFPNGRVYRTTVYLDNTLVLYQSAGTYTLPNRVYVNDNTTQNDNVYVLYFTTAKLNQSPTISVESKTYDGSAVSYDAGTGYGTCTVNFTGINGTSYDSTTAPSTAGDYRMTVSYEGDGNYNSWSGTADFTISRATPNYTVPSNLTALCGQTLADVTLPTGWEWVNPSTSLSSVGENTFKATYTPTDTTNYNVVDNVDVTVNVSIPAYTVTWKNEDGTVLETDENVKKGSTPSYDGATPTKAADNDYTYTFSGWTDGTNNYSLTDTLPPVTADITYTATFTAKSASGTYWRLTDDDNDGKYKLIIFGTIPNTGGYSPWRGYASYITEVTTEAGAKTSADARYLFQDLSTTVMDLSHLDTSDTTNMVGMFNSCRKVTSLNLSNFDTSNVTNMSGMFNGCTNLTTLDLSSFNTSNVEIMSNMFLSCTNLTSLNLNRFNTSNVTSMSNMFNGCGNLTTLDLSSFNTSNVTNMGSMFNGCENLTTLDLSSFNTSNVTSMTSMFQNCKSLTTLDLSGFNTQKVNYMGNMFYGCEELTTIYVGNDWNTGTVTSSNGMFSDCKKLVGGQGTIFDSSKTDKTYAHIDGGTDNPGYLTSTVASIDYTVVWKNADGTVLETDENVAENATPSYDGAPPTKAEDDDYTYTFSGWTDGTNNYSLTDTLPPVTTDITYTAVFESTVNTYTVTWVDGDGNTTTDTVAYGEIPVYSGETPTKTATAQYTYTFSGWDNEPTAVTGNATYTAQFTESTNTYTVIWKNEDGTTLETDTDVAYGTTPKYNGTKPAKDSTAEYRYILSWTDGTNTYPDSAVPEVTGDVTYTVTFTAEKHYIDTTHHAWYTFDITTGHMEIYGDGQSFTFGKEIYTNFDGANGSKTDIRNLIKSVHFNSGIVPTAMNKWLYNCRYLTTVTGTIPNAQTANAMFLECQRLESVPNMPSITGNKAINMFKNCYALTTIGNSVFTIHANQIENMFYNCHNLSAHITFDTRPTTTNPESHVANLFTGAATADGTEITVCFSGLAKRDGFDSLVIPQIESASGNVKQHDFPEFTDDSNGTTHSRVCSQCGKTETESHTFDNGICTVCGAKEIYTITVTNGTITTGEKESYNVGDIVTLKADAPEEGKVFAYWEDGNGNKLSTKANYSFVVLKSVDLTAVYNNDYVAEAILDISAVQTSSNGKNAIRFVFNRSVDTKAEVEEVGLIYATNKLAGYTGYTSGAKVNLTELEGFDIETVLKENTSGTVKTYKSTSTSINGTIRFTYTIGNNTDCYVYAYGYVKLSDGTTLYTDLIATTYNSIG